MSVPNAHDPVRLPEAVRDAMQTYVARLHNAIGELLVGVYVVGSATSRDFESASSDIDVVCVLTRELELGEVTALRELHRALQDESSEGANLEVEYVARDQLRPTGAEGEVVSISPGEDVHVGRSSSAADDIWGARNYGVPLFGPPPTEVFPDVDRDTLIRSCRASLADYATRDQRPDATDDDYVDWTLNIARCLFGIDRGRCPTKPEAAHWLARREPKLTVPLDAALAARRGEPVGAAVRSEFRWYADTVCSLADDLMPLHRGRDEPAAEVREP